MVWDAYLRVSIHCCPADLNDTLLVFRPVGGRGGRDLRQVRPNRRALLGLHHIRGIVQRHHLLAVTKKNKILQKYCAWKKAEIKTRGKSRGSVHCRGFHLAEKKNTTVASIPCTGYWSALHLPECTLKARWHHCVSISLHVTLTRVIPRAQLQLIERIMCDLHFDFMNCSCVSMPRQVCKKDGPGSSLSARCHYLLFCDSFSARLDDLNSTLNLFSIHWLHGTLTQVFSVILEHKYAPLSGHVSLLLVLLHLFGWDKFMICGAFRYRSCGVLNSRLKDKLLVAAHFLPWTHFPI